MLFSFFSYFPLPLSANNPEWSEINVHHLCKYFHFQIQYLRIKLAQFFFAELCFKLIIVLFIVECVCECESLWFTWFLRCSVFAAAIVNFFSISKCEKRKYWHFQSLILQFTPHKSKFNFLWHISLSRFLM